jgi:hypothetical protein
VAGCKDNRAPRGGDDDGSSAVAQINTSERKSVRLPWIKRVQEPRIAQGQRIPVRDLLKSLRTPEIVIPRSTNPSNSKIFRRWAPQQPTTDFFRAK